MKTINLKLDMELDLVEIEKEPVLVTVTAMNFGDAEPVMTQVKLKEVLDNVVNISKNQVKRENRSTTVSVAASDDLREKKLNFKQDIDVRGMRGEEVLQAVMYFVDDAQMLSIGRIRILHGTGTGALRQAIRDYLHGSSAVAAYRDEHVQFGGAGITVVELN